MSDVPAFTRARELAAAMGERIKRALEAHVSADSTALGRHLRALETAHARLADAHDDLERALADGGSDPTVNPTGAMGAQTSAGQSPRDFSPEAIRRRDQLRGCEAGYAVRLKRMGFSR